MISNLIQPNPCPMYLSEISCGLFGIIDDFREERLSLDEKFLKSQDSTFFVRAAGDSMLPEIKPKDILIIDRSRPLRSGCFGAFFLNGHAICKQYFKDGDKIILRSCNLKYKDILLNEDDHLEVFGVVIGLTREFFVR